MLDRSRIARIYEHPIYQQASAGRRRPASGLDDGRFWVDRREVSDSPSATQRLAADAVDGRPLRSAVDAIPIRRAGDLSRAGSRGASVRRYAPPLASRSSPSTLMSSSRSGQWIPWPSPSSSTLARCAGVACRSRGSTRLLWRAGRCQPRKNSFQTSSNSSRWRKATSSHPLLAREAMPSGYTCRGSSTALARPAADAVAWRPLSSPTDSSLGPQTAGRP